MPREEVKQLYHIVKKAARSIEANIIIKCCGSYRRNSVDCGDIDILLSHPNFTTEQRLRQEEPLKIIERLVALLTKKKYIIDHLFRGPLQYSGICILKNQSNATPRKIDLKLFPIESFHTGLLAYTGSGEFIRQISSVALNKGFKLNEYQLVAVGLSGHEGSPIPISSEKEVFDMLQITYREPSSRSFGGTHLNKNRSI